jgi:hypothetical protein
VIEVLCVGYYACPDDHSFTINDDHDIVVFWAEVVLRSERDILREVELSEASFC